MPRCALMTSLVFVLAFHMGAARRIKLTGMGGDEDSDAKAAQRGRNATKTGGARVVEFSMDGVSRRFELYICSGCKGQAVPLVLVIPGTMQSIVMFEPWTLWHKMADAETFATVVIEPADPKVFLTQFGVSTSIDSMTLKYVSEVFAKVQQSNPELLQDGNIFCTGFSRGGRMCSHLPTDFTEYRFRGIAPVASVRFPLKPPQYRVPVIAIHQTEDHSNLWSGFGSYMNQTVPDSIKGWATHNGCTENATSDLPAIGGLKTTLEHHSGCSDGADVDMIALTGKIYPDDGHNWPDFRETQAKGESATTRYVWDFFKRHVASASGNAAAVGAEATASSTTSNAPKS